jgi:translation initiation factor RLI1
MGIVFLVSYRRESDCRPRIISIGQILQQLRQKKGTYYFVG